MRSTESTYLPGLDHLRFVAAFLVLVWHGVHFGGQVPTSNVPGIWPLSILEEGHTGVSLFMTLSGFIFMVLSRHRRIVYLEFVRNRLLRIAPLFVVWTFLLFCLGESEPVKLFVAMISLLNRDAVPGVGWTIIVEFQFYMLFPFILAFWSRYGLRYPVGLLALALLLRLCVWYARGSVQMLAFWTIFGRIDQFVFGMLAGELFLRRQKWIAQPLLLVVLVVSWLGIYHAFNRLGGFYDNGGYPTKSAIWIYWPTLEGLFYAAITVSYVGLAERLPRALSKALAWLGALSYSLYLNHVFALEVGFKATRALGWQVTGLGQGLLFAVAMLPPVVVISAATYYLIERPFLLLRRNYFREVDPEAAE